MITVCKARIKDVEHIIPFWRNLMKFHQELLSEHNPELSEFFVTKKDGEQRSIEFLKHQIRSKNGMILVAKEEERIVGYTNLMIKEYIPLFEIDWIGEIIALYVDETYRGKQVSSLLLQKSKEWFKQKGIHHVMLNVFPDNHHAKEIYDHWG
jgi:GNAT superfamily N-acetyltransferase